MNRRQALKALSLAGLTPFLASMAPWPSVLDRSSFFLLTDRPADDLPRLLRLIGAEAEAMETAVRPMPPAAQDLSLLRQGHLVDPTRTPDVPPPVAHLAAELRARPHPGTALVTVEPRQAAPHDEVVFEYDGRVYDRVSLHRSYARIEMPGRLGPTVFRLHDGQLSVVTSSCRHQLCKKMSGQATGRIICAPNRLVATLPRPALPGIDAITG